MRKLTLFLLTSLFSGILLAQPPCLRAQRSGMIPGSVSPGTSPLESLYDVKFYFIEVEADDSSANIRGRTSILLESLHPIDTLVFELTASQVADSIVVNGTEAEDFIQEDELLRIIPAEPLDSGKLNMITVRYAGTTSAGGFFTGLSNGHDYVYGQNVTFTLSEPYEAKDWFPVKQDLQDKVDSVWVFITTREGLMAGSNGLLTSVSHPEEGKVRYEWKSHYPTDFYLISFTLADYIDYSFYASSDVLDDSVLIQNFIYNTPDILEREKANIDITGDFLIYFSELFGQYPFIREKYGHCMAPIGGGMEHQTMTTLQNFGFELVSHELTHQWFGDNVTCGSWRDIWLNEGFASYGEYLALYRFRGREEAVKWMSDAHDRAMNDPSASLYLSEREVKDQNRIFNYNITYKKGASIIHNLRYELNNDSLFFGILREYQRMYKDSTALVTDLIRLINTMSGKDYTWFFDQWYYGSGFPVLETSWSQKNDSLILDSWQVQENAGNHIFHMHLDYMVTYADSSREFFRVWYEKLHQRISLPVNQKVIRVTADPDLYILMKSNVYKEFQQSAYFELSPNPFSRYLDLRFANPAPGREIYIVNTAGKLVYQSLAEDSNVHPDLSALGQGLFLLVILTPGGKKYTARIVKGQ